MKMRTGARGATGIGSCGWAAAAVLALVASPAAAKVWPIAPGPDSGARLEAALASSTASDVIRLAAGRYEIARPLRLAKDGVTLEGAGPRQTTLSFKAKPVVADQDANGAITLAADRLILQGFSIVDAPGPAIVGRGLHQLTVQNISASQSLGRRPNGPGMQVRIFASSDTLFDGLDLRHATISGLQISTSDRVVVRNSRFEDNSTGLEVENDYGADVYDNVMTRNSTGVMFLDMPSYPHTGSHALRAFHNRIIANNAPSAAQGIASTARQGMGVLIMGGVSDVHLFENQIADHGDANVVIAALPWQIDNPTYNAVPNDLIIRNNVFGASGFAPVDNLAALHAAGEPLADVVWDGATHFLANGLLKSSEPLRLTLKDNVRIDAKPVTYLSLGLTIADGGMLVATPNRTAPAEARGAEPQPVRLPQDKP